MDSRKNSSFVSFLILFFLLSSCTEKIISNGKNPIPDQAVSKITDRELLEVSIEDDGRSQTPLSLQSLNFSDPESVVLKLDPILFGERSHSESYVYSKEYTQMLNVYLSMMVELKVADQSAAARLSPEVVQSLNQFKARFFDSCIRQNLEESCKMLSFLLIEANTSVEILFYFLHSENDPETRMKYIKMAFDLTSLNEFSKIRLRALFLRELIFNSTHFNLSLRQGDFVKSIIFMKDLNWKENAVLLEDLIEKTRAWELESSENQILKAWAGALTPYLFEYYKRKPEKLSVLERKVAAQLKSNSPQHMDILSDLNLGELLLQEGLGLTERVFNVFLFSFYLEKINWERASMVIAQIKFSESEVLYVKEVFEKTIRYDISSLAKKSSQQISTSIQKRQDQRLSAFEDVIVNQDIPVKSSWAKFHVRADRYRVFMDLISFDKYPQIWSQFAKFQDSISSNIFKIAVVPNYIGLYYLMDEYNVTFKQNVLGIVTEVNAKSKLQRLYLGKFQSHFLPFLKVTAGSLGEKADGSLSQSEFLEALYYFAKIGGHKDYKISVDDLLQKLAKILISEDLNTLEQANREIYRAYSQTNSASLYLNWCSQIEESTETPETLNLVELDKYLLPYTSSLQQEVSGAELLDLHDDAEDERIEQRKHFSHFHDHVYSWQGTLYSNIGLNRFFLRRYLKKLEYLKLMKTSLQSASSEKELAAASSYIQRADDASLRFWGLQNFYFKKYSDCSLVALKELKRRISKLILYEKRNLERIRRKISTFLSSGSGNLYWLKRSLSLTPYENLILSKDRKTITYSISKLGLLFHLKKYLQEGLPEASLPPVVGPHLTIVVPAHLDGPNSEFIKNPKVHSASLRASSLTEDGEEFLSSFIEKFFEMERSTNVQRSSYDWSNWLQSEMTLYKEQQPYRISQMALLYQNKDLPYYDYQNSGCNYRKESSELCLRLGSGMTLDEVSATLGQVYDAYKILPLDVFTLETLGQSSYIDWSDFSFTVDSDFSLFSTKHQYNLDQAHTFDQIKGVYDFFVDQMSLEKSIFSKDTSSLFMWETLLNPYRASNMYCGYDLDWVCSDLLLKDYAENRNLKRLYFYYFPESLLEKQYQFYKGIAQSKYSSLVEAVEQIPGFAKKYQLQDREIRFRVNSFKDKFSLYPLSQRYQNFDTMRAEYLGAFPQNLFSQEPDWEEYLMVK